MIVGIVKVLVLLGSVRLYFCLAMLEIFDLEVEDMVSLVVELDDSSWYEWIHHDKISLLIHLESIFRVRISYLLIVLSMGQI